MASNKQKKQCVNINCESKNNCEHFIHYMLLKASSESEEKSLKRLAEAQPKRKSCMNYQPKRNKNEIF